MCSTQLVAFISDKEGCIVLKKISYLTLLIILLFSLAACNETRDTSYEDSQISTKESKEKASNSDSDIPANDLTEMRGSDLRVRRVNLDSLSLDGEHYEFPEEALEMLDSTHINISYPLVFDGYKVYNLEKEKLLFTVEDIISNLEKDWGETIAVNDVPSFGEKEFEPDFFQYIDNASLSPSSKKVAFSIHNYLAATYTSIIGIFNIENNEINFVEGPSKGQVNEISWSPDEKHFAYTISSIMEGDESDKINLYVINSKDFNKTASAKPLELFEEEIAKERAQEELYRRIKLSEWLDDRKVAVQLKYVDKNDNVKEKFIESIKY